VEQTAIPIQKAVLPFMVWIGEVTHRKKITRSL